MRWLRAGTLLGAAFATGGTAVQAGWWEREGVGSLVGVRVELDGRTAPLYPAPDGGPRHYLEARAGARYAVVLVNRTHERLGVELSVDGLNAISGERDTGRGRMYVLGPWEETTVRGWRSSLSEVRQFTFVDERASYAARSGKANGRMGWIEVAVYRERRPAARRPCRPWTAPCEDGAIDRRMEPEGRDSARGEKRSEAMPYSSAPEEAHDADEAPAPEAPASGAARSREDKAGSRSADLYRPAPTPAPGRSYPGTGWGDRTYDPVTVVDFRAEPAPAEHVTLRYEYAGALRALGILPRHPWGRDRLGERERGDLGFAPPPRY